MTGASLKGRPKSPMHIENMRLVRIGKPHPHKGTPRSSEITVQRISEGHKGKSAWNKGKPRTETDKNKITIATREAMHRPEVYVKLVGENHPNWQGGIAFEPYCPKFNDKFKERVRAFFGYICVECGTPEKGERLHIHHVNFNKETCCDNSTPLFVPLCRSCHGKTGHNRPFWQYWFTEMINLTYGGHCWCEPYTGVLAQRRAMGET